MRVALAEAVRALDAGATGVLHAIYASDSRDLCDAENVLLYNVGPANFAAAAPVGLRFERSYDVPDAPNGHSSDLVHYHRYWIAPLSGGLANRRRGATVAAWSSARCGALSPEPKPGPVWYAIKKADRDMRGEIGSGEFGLTVTARGPAGHAPNAARLVKPLFDGIISAFHAYSGPPILAELSERIGRALEVEPTEVLALLTDESSGALDSRAVVRLHGLSGVAWNPADERCVAGELRIEADSTATEWELAGELFVVE